MKLAAIRHTRLLSGTIAVLVFALGPAVYADTFPYIKASGSDVWAGGWFQSSGSCDSGSSNYQDQFTDSNNDQKAGGVDAFVGDHNGSSGDFGVYALGLIDKTGGSPNAGFNSDTVGAGGSKLTFEYR